MPLCGDGCGECLIRWCGRRDLNPHDFRHGNLNPARLPIPPRPLGRTGDALPVGWVERLRDPAPFRFGSRKSSTQPTELGGAAYIRQKGATHAKNGHIDGIAVGWVELARPNILPTRRRGVSRRRSTQPTRCANPNSKCRLQLEMVEAVDGLDVDPLHLVVLQHIKRNRRAGRPSRPCLAVELA